MLESNGLNPTVSVQRLPHGADLPLPAYATPQTAGRALMAAGSDDLTRAPGAPPLSPPCPALARPARVEANSPSAPSATTAISTSPTHSTLAWPVSSPAGPSSAG